MTTDYHLPVTTGSNVTDGMSVGEFNEWRRSFYGKAGRCQYCGAKFAASETVIMARDWDMYGDWIAVCAGCANHEELAAALCPITCRGCGQSMLTPRRGSRQNLWTGESRAIRSQTCSKRCEQRYQRQLQRENREKVNCCVCSRLFRPKRSAKFCSGACRQWAYRRPNTATERPRVRKTAAVRGSSEGHHHRSWKYRR